MNPEEGRLRPQILDRFGLRVNVRGLMDIEERAEVYRRARAYRRNPTRFIKEWEQLTAEAQEEIVLARDFLKDTVLKDDILKLGLELVRRLAIDSHRAEYTMFEAARAHAAADFRTEIEPADLRAVAPLALRQRQSEFMSHFFEAQALEDVEIDRTLDELIE
jgi:magnesium chelatase subunit I